MVSHHKWTAPWFDWKWAETTLSGWFRPSCFVPHLRANAVFTYAQTKKKNFEGKHSRFRKQLLQMSRVKVWKHPKVQQHLNPNVYVYCWCLLPLTILHLSATAQQGNWKHKEGISHTYIHTYKICNPTAFPPCLSVVRLSNDWWNRFFSFLINMVNCSICLMDCGLLVQLWLCSPFSAPPRFSLSFPTIHCLTKTKKIL